MIIDVHRHMWSAAQRHRAAFAALGAEHQRPQTDFDWRQVGEEAVREMDSVGISRTVIFTADFEFPLGVGHFPIEEENALVMRTARTWPHRFVPFYGIDPRREGAAELFENAVLNGGARGIKLHPCAGFSPSDPICYPIYEVCSQYKLPALFHVGVGFHPQLYSVYAHPYEFDRVAAQFPRLSMILAHAGGAEWWRECVTIARPHPNMFLELSEWQLTIASDPLLAVDAISNMIRQVGVDRMVWGSDFPGKRSYFSMEHTVEMFRNLPETAERFKVEILPADIETILGGTASTSLGL